MSFNKKTWTDRISEFITRRLLTKADGSTEQVTVSRDEGEITQEGTPLNAESFNDLEGRIESAFSDTDDAISQLNTHLTDYVPFKLAIDSSGNYGYKKVGADTVIPFKHLYIVPYSVISANLKNATMYTNTDDSFGFTCTGTVSALTLNDYIGTKITIDLTNYSYLFWNFQKIVNHGQETVRIYNKNGSFVKGFQVRYANQNGIAHSDCIDVSELSGTYYIIFHGGYTDSTGSSSSQSKFWQIMLF